MQSVAAQEVSLQVGVDSNDVLIGDQIHLTVRLSFPSDQYALMFPNVNEMYTSPFKIIAQSPIDTTESARFTTYKQTTTIAAYDSGFFLLPKIYANGFNTTADSAVSIVGDSIFIHVAEVMINKDGDIKDIIESKNNEKLFRKIAIIIASVILLLLLAHVIYRLVMAQRKKIALQKTDPFMLCMQQLNAAKQLPINTSEQQKIFFTQVTDAYKLYMQKRIGLSVVDKTSEETIALIQQNKSTVTVAPQAQSLFALADMIKFAKSSTSPEQCQQAIAQSIGSVQTLENNYQQQQKQLAEMQKK
jgi:hypothetical protein